MTNYRYHTDCSSYECKIYTAYIRINKKLTKVGYYYTDCHKFSLCDESKTNILQPESPLLLQNDEYSLLAKFDEEKLLFESNEYLLD